MRFENSDMNISPLLLRQCILAINVEVASRNRRCCLELTSADADGVIALRNHGIASSIAISVDLASYCVLLFLKSSGAN
jgi:hypothetical protein